MSAVLHRIEPILPRGVRFTHDQLRAFYGILEDMQYRRHKGAVLRGYAGCGKTWLAAFLVETLKEYGYRVALAAPTNKAAGVLQGSLAKVCGDSTAVVTLHSLLGLKAVRHIDGRLEFVQKSDAHISQYDLILVDECSMVSHRIFDLLLACNAYLLFLGDPAQLPPVGYQTESPTFSHPGFAQFELREVVRQKGDSSILNLASDIRNAKKPFSGIFQYADGKSLRLMRHSDFQMSEVTADTRILAWTNKSVDRYNLTAHNLRFPWGQSPYSAEERLVLQSGLRVGDYSFSNGTEAVIVSVENAMHPDWSDVPAWKMRVVMAHGLRYPSPDEAISGVIENSRKEPDALANVEVTIWIAQNPQQVERLEEYCFQEAKNAIQKNSCNEAERWAMSGWKLRDDFARVKHAYASTVHKSQGSTYHTAVVDLKDLQNPKARGIFNRLLYTAITRPSAELVILQ